MFGSCVFQKQAKMLLYFTQFREATLRKGKKKIGQVLPGSLSWLNYLTYVLIFFLVLSLLSFSLSLFVKMHLCLLTAPDYIQVRSGCTSTWYSICSLTIHIITLFTAHFMLFNSKLKINPSRTSWGKCSVRHEISNGGFFFFPLAESRRVHP